MSNKEDNIKTSVLVDQAKTAFILNEPKNTFLTSLLCSIPLKIVDVDTFEDGHPATARVNAFGLEFGEKFFRSLTKDERKGLMAHEVMHLALKHVDPARYATRDFKRWNIAGDHVINNMLINQGFKIPKGGCCDPQYADMSTEEVYDLLPESVEMPSGGAGMDIDPNGGQGDSENSPGQTPTPQQQKAIQEQLDRLVMKAATQAEMAGEKLAGMVPADVLRHIENLKNPIVPWYDLLIDFFLSKAKEDYSMSRPNKRYMPDFCMPSLYSESMGKIVFICDASGSISEEQFTRFYSEASYVKDLMKPEEFVIASFDTQIHSVHRFAKDEYLETPKLKGGGGTAINPVLEFLAKEEADVAVVFTDGYFWDTDNMHNFKHLDENLFWLIDENPSYECDFGRIVHFVE